MRKEDYEERYGNRDPKDFGMYFEVIDSFRTYHPKTYEKMRCCRPAGRFNIEITCHDGTQWYYNFFEHSIRRTDIDREDDYADNKDALRREFGIRLKNKLKEEQITQKMLSEMTGISENTISAYIRGARSAEWSVIRKIANAIHCSTDELINF